MQQSKMRTLYQGNAGRGIGSYYPPTPVAKNGAGQGIEYKLADEVPDPKQTLTVSEVAIMLSLHPRTVKRGLDGLPEQVKYVRRDGSYVRAYCLSDVVLFLEKASGQPFPEGPLEPLLTNREVAGRLNVYIGAVYRWNRKSILHGFRVGSDWRYYPRDVEAFAKSFNSKLTAKEVAGRLGVSPNTVYRWNKKSILRGFRLGDRWRYDTR